jgi:hypothetical protein
MAYFGQYLWLVTTCRASDTAKCEPLPAGEVGFGGGGLSVSEAPDQGRGSGTVKSSASSSSSMGTGTAGLVHITPPGFMRRRAAVSRRAAVLEVHAPFGANTALFRPTADSVSLGSVSECGIKHVREPDAGLLQLFLHDGFVLV